MATVEQQLIQAIEGDAACQTHFGATPATRIYPMTMPENTAYPAMTYQRISNARVNSFDAGGGIDNPRVQVDVWAQTRKAAREAAMEVKRVVEATTLFGGWLVDDREDHDDTIEPALYRVSMDFSLWMQET